MENITKVNCSHGVTQGLACMTGNPKGKIPVTPSLQAGVGNFSQKIPWPTCSRASHSVWRVKMVTPRGLGWRGKLLAEPYPRQTEIIGGGTGYYQVYGQARNPQLLSIHQPWLLPRLWPVQKHATFVHTPMLRPGGGVWCVLCGGDEGWWSWRRRW